MDSISRQDGHSPRSLARERTFHRGNSRQKNRLRLSRLEHPAAPGLPSPNLISQSQLECGNEVSNLHQRARTRTRPAGVSRVDPQAPITCPNGIREGPTKTLRFWKCASWRLRQPRFRTRISPIRGHHGRTGVSIAPTRPSDA